MILFSELSDRRIRSISSLIKVGRIEPVMVLRVGKNKGYIDLSKRRVSEEDIQTSEERYNKSKLVHSIMRHVAETVGVDLEDLYVNIGWPLYKKNGHAFEAFKIIVTDPDPVLNTLTREVKEIGPDDVEVTKVVPAVSEELKDKSWRGTLKGGMTPQPLKIRADVELKCFQFDGVLHIKEGSDDCPVKIKLVAPPLYVLTTQTLDKDKGIVTLNKAIEACITAIENQKGKLVIKEGARAVSERDDKLLAEHMDNEEISGEEEEEEHAFFSNLTKLPRRRRTCFFLEPHSLLNPLISSIFSRTSLSAQPSYKLRFFSNLTKLPSLNMLFDHGGQITFT